MPLQVYGYKKSVEETNYSTSFRKKKIKDDLEVILILHEVKL